MVQSPQADFDHPLLVFPEPTSARRSKLGGGGGRLRVPHPDRQAERLAPQFRRLQEAMDRKRLALQTGTHGLQPEQVLVLETVGSIENFINALRKIPGLEWLGEFEDTSVTPDFGFESERNPDRLLSGQLFLVMTDQAALSQIQEYFNQWQADPERKFDRGLKRIKDAFEHLRNIRPWDADDRIRDTGILDDWRDRLDVGEDLIPFAAELWFRGNATQRQVSATEVRRIVESADGQMVQECTIPEIGYHAILARIPRGHIQDIVERPDMLENVRLLQLDGIMYVRPVGQCAVLIPDDSDINVAPEDETLDERARPTEEPIVAVLDGMPLAGHQLLVDRIVIDDPDEFETSYLARERFHGTAMASLICHGDLNEGTAPVNRLVHFRPIMKPTRGFDGHFAESIPEDVLHVDLIHRAVRRLFEFENGEPPSAPNVRVINLSVCDRYRPFDREVSPWARLIDWLSWKYNVLFVVSAGNHAHDIELDVARDHLSQLNAEQRQASIIEAVSEDTRNRRLLSPAEAINGLTVAATHDDFSVVPPNRLVDPFAHAGLPNVINAQGPGYRRTIKPEVLLPGGRQYLMEKVANALPKAVLEVPLSNSAPGQRVATPGIQGALNGICHTRGTSNAAALASRSAMLIYDVIEDIRLMSPPGSLPQDYDAVLLKALLAHGSDWSDAGELYDQILKNGQNSKTFKDYVGRFLGYGTANIAKVLACTQQRVTVLGVGALGDGSGDEFSFPLPPSLSTTTERRRLTITLAWLTPTSNTRQSYRVAHLWFNPTQQNDLARTRLNADHRAVRRGTLQHEVLEGDSAIPFQDGENIIIKVNCRNDAGEIVELIRYGLAVTLEVAEGTHIPIYPEVRQRLAERVRLQALG